MQGLGAFTKPDGSCYQGQWAAGKTGAVVVHDFGSARVPLVDGHFGFGSFWGLPKKLKGEGSPGGLGVARSSSQVQARFPRFRGGLVQARCKVGRFRFRRFWVVSRFGRFRRKKKQASSSE